MKAPAATEVTTSAQDKRNFTRNIIKTAIVSFVAGLIVSACSPVHAGAEWAQAQHQRNLQANQPQNHAQQAQAATEKVAPKPI